MDNIMIKMTMNMNENERTMTATHHHARSEKQQKNLKKKGFVHQKMTLHDGNHFKIHFFPLILHLNESTAPNIN